MLRSSLVRTLTDRSQLAPDSACCCCAARKGESTSRTKTNATPRIIVPPSSAATRRNCLPRTIVAPNCSHFNVPHGFSLCCGKGGTLVRPLRFLFSLACHSGCSSPAFSCTPLFSVPGYEVEGPLSDSRRACVGRDINDSGQQPEYRVLFDCRAAPTVPSGAGVGRGKRLSVAPPFTTSSWPVSSQAAPLTSAVRRRLLATSMCPQSAAAALH